MQNYNLSNCTREDANFSFRLWLFADNLPPENMCFMKPSNAYVLMDWHVLNKHMSPSHYTLRSLAYGPQNLGIVQSAIQHESLLKCNRLNISCHNITSSRIRMLFYLMGLHLSLITIWAALLPTLKKLSVIPADEAGFGRQTDFIRFLIHTWKRKHITKIYWILALSWSGNKWIL